MQAYDVVVYSRNYGAAELVISEREYLLSSGTLVKIHSRCEMRLKMYLYICVQSLIRITCECFIYMTEFMILYTRSEDGAWANLQCKKQARGIAGEIYIVNLCI